MPRVDTPPSTHFDNCWRVHPECAVAMIEQWLPVIEAAKAFHEIDAVCRQNVREGRRAAAPIIMRDGAMDRLKSAIDAALAEEEHGVPSEK